MGEHVMSRSSIGLAVFLLCVSFIAGCGKRAPESSAEVIAFYTDILPSEPADPKWDLASIHVEPLLPQDLVEPRLVEPSTGRVRLRACTDGTRIAFRIDWDDETRDDQPSASNFPDTCAVQLPLKTERDAPDPQMGEPGRPVRITFWSAFWQSSLDGRADTIYELHPGATVDHYPFQAPPLEEDSEARKAMALRYAPARFLGNYMAGPRDSAIQDLIAEGPGTLSRSDVADSTGSGRRTVNGWSVVICRMLPEGLNVGGQTQMAVAVANGSRAEAGSRKMRSAWIPLVLEAVR